MSCSDNKCKKQKTCFSEKEKPKGISRRNFIRYGLEAGAMTALVGGLSILPTNKNYIRPPHAADEATFYQKCIKCGACVEACSLGALEQLDLGLDFKNIGTPVLNTEHGGCITWHKTCLKCVEACPTDALLKPPKPVKLKIGYAEIKPKACVNCMLCFLKCPIEGAILFPNPKGKPFTKENQIPTELKTVHAPLKPYIDIDKCVGCGLCAYYCPVKVVDMHPLPKGQKS